MVIEPPAINARITRYTVCALPEDHPGYRHFAITVEYRGRERWAVVYGTQVLSASGDWDYEPLNSERTDAWNEAHRFSEDTAIRLAREQAPRITVNARTAAAALAGHPHHEE